MSQQDFDKIFEVFQESVRKMPEEVFISMKFDHEESQKDFYLLEAEKNEIVGVFNVMRLVSTQDFKNLMDNDDISVTISNLLVKVREDPPLLDFVRRIINPTVGKKFNKFLKESEFTYEKGSSGNVYDQHFMRFCTLLYARAGKKAYSALELNGTMPTVEACKKNIKQNYGELNIGKIYGKKLREHLERHNLPKSVTISEDATRLKTFVKYDPRSQELIGMVMKNESNGLPNHIKLKVKTPQDIMYLMKNYQRANFIEVIMAKSIAGG